MTRTPPSRELMNEKLERLRKEARELERELSPTSVKRKKDKLRQLRRRIDVVVAQRDSAPVAPRKPTRPARPVSTLSRRQMAGEENIRRVDETLERYGPLFQAELSKRSGVGTGTITHALRALEEDGRVVPTGRVGPHGSKEFRRLKRRRRATTMEPGS